MDIVAVNAVVLQLRPYRSIPVAVHAAMGAVVVVPRLRTMALPAQLDGIAHRDQRAVGAVQRCLIAYHVTRCARLPAVRKR